MKRFFILLTGCMAIIMLAGCTASSVQSENALDRWKSTIIQQQDIQQNAHVTVLNMSHSADENGYIQTAAETMKQRLEMVSGGSMSINIYPNNTISSLESAMSSFCGGSVDMRIGTAGNRFFTIFSWMPLFEEFSLAEYENMLSSDANIRALLETYSEESGVYTLGTLPVQYRVVASVKPCGSLSELSVLSMRSIDETSSDNLFWKALCAEVHPMNAQSVRLALQQGEVDACDNTILNLEQYGLLDSVNYINTSPFRLYYDSIYIQKETMDTLSEQEQAWVRDAADYTCRIMHTSIKQHNSATISELMQQGVEFSEFSRVDLLIMKEKTKKLLEERLLRSFTEEEIRNFHAAAYRDVAAQEEITY